VAESLRTRDLSELTSWHSDWSGVRAVVLGLDAVGFSVVDTLCELGAQVIVIVREAEQDVVNIAQVLGAEVVQEAQSEKYQALVSTVVPDLVVVSPNVSEDDPLALGWMEQGIPVLSDVDFAWRVRDKFPHVADWIVVAGDRYGPGVAQLALRICHADGQVIGLAGVSAPPILDLIREPLDYDTIIVLASSASLTRWGNYHHSGREPLVSVVVEQEATAHLAMAYEGTRSACVYWRGGGPTESFVEQADVVEGARAIGLGAGSPGMSEIGLVEGIICDRAFLEDRAHQALEISTLEELAEAGRDVVADLPVIFGAIAIARALDVSPALIAGVLSLP
jgi:UDP-N-acetylmuramoylalanine--D-glutamate ligase